MQRLQLTLPGVASSVPPARHFVERTLDAWELAHISWTAALVVTELAANAALHAGTEFTVCISTDGRQVRVEVSDGSLHLPRQRRHSAEATTGRGLRLVADLALKWGVHAMSDGKTVWVELSTAVGGNGEDADADIESLLDAFSDELEDTDVAGFGRAMLGLAA